MTTLSQKIERQRRLGGSQSPKALSLTKKFNKQQNAAAGNYNPKPKGPKPKGPAGPGGGGKGPNAPRGPFPTGPLSYKQFLQEEHAAENQQFSPLQRQLDREGAASDFRRTQEDPAWFAQYKQNVADLGKQTQDAYSSALDRIQNFSAQAGAQDQAGRAATVQQLQQDAATRGTTVDPSVIANGQNAQAARSNLTGTMQSVIAGQGANQAAYMNNRQSIGDQLGREAQQKELARMLGIQGDQRELQSKRGDFRTQYRADTRESERKYNLGQQTIAGENKRANLSSRTSTANNIRSTSTSAANSKRSSATSRANNAATTGQTEANRKATNRRDRKNRNERRWAHNHPQASNSGKGKSKGKR